MSETTSLYAGLGIVVSLVFHGAAFWGLGKVPEGTLKPALTSMVDFEVQANKAELEPPPAPEPEPDVEEPPPPDQPAAYEPATEPEPEPQAAEPEVADLTGLTLTNAGTGAGWASAVGNGQVMERPIRAGVAAKSAAREPVNAPAPVVRRATKPIAPVVAAKDLSRKPLPPNLNGVLETHYPKSAREMGLEGSAVVRLRIDPDGRVRLANVVSESGSGFGDACQRTVMGSNWSAPLDQQGNSVATFVRYTCRFRVNR
jgi:protein TonB